MKKNITSYLETNNNLATDHHENIVNQSALTAKVLIDYQAAKAIDEDKVCVILLTDLLSAYDNVNYAILFTQIKHEQIKGIEFHNVLLGSKMD